MAVSQSNTLNHHLLFNRVICSSLWQSLAQTELWIEQKQMQIAKYYLTLGNHYGAEIYLKRILSKADASLGTEARKLLDQMQAEDKLKAKQP